MQQYIFIVETLQFNTVKHVVNTIPRQKILYHALFHENGLLPLIELTAVRR